MSKRKYTDVDVLETACAMGDLYAGVNSLLSKSMRTEVVYWIYKSIMGEASGFWENYASDMIYWLERKISSEQYTQFKTCQNSLVKYGVIPGPRKS